MRPFSEIVYSFGVVIRVIALLLTIVETAILIHAFRYKRGVGYRAFAVAQLCAGLFLMIALLDGSYTVDYADRVRAYPGFVNLIYHAPWGVILTVELILSAAAIIGVCGIRRYHRTNLSRDSIKEAVDMLEVGVCFAQTDGVVVLKNLLMDEICMQITGKALGDAADFWNTAEKRGERGGDALFVTDGSGRAVQITNDMVTLDGTEYMLLLASDFSEQYRITAELKEKQSKLLRIRRRMRDFGEESERLAMAEETLKARTNVHDEINRVLLIGKYYLDHPDSADGFELIGAARQMNRMLTRDVETPDIDHNANCIGALEAARDIGVTVDVTGELPNSETSLELLGKAIREAAANVVKHADGDRLEVAVTHENGYVTAVLRGNGNAPQKPIVESGGLLNLRQSIEPAGGELIVTCEPQVTLTVTIPTE